jgi:oligoendopeptidase F
MQEKYIKFLSSGSSLPPLETLKIVGIDLEKEESFDEAFEFIGKIEKDFENLVQNQKQSLSMQ